ncbi:hypothetical protein pdam_00025309 [Pocillopora damicornis]|uniref:Uncharacterized protein n=1 Tax=Pocillopora damicornis TaxID=46731 RepID=A0A3M6U8L7_POCDA|nr:hypothetical protein pdam_00025309 [Pocillopora damicornis]
MLHRYDVENFNYGGEGRNLKERTNTGYFYTLHWKGCSCMAKMYAFRSSISKRFYSLMSLALCFIPASKTPVTNTYHYSNQGQLTNEFS